MTAARGSKSAETRDAFLLFMLSQQRPVLSKTVSKQHSFFEHRPKYAAYRFETDNLCELIDRELESFVGAVSKGLLNAGLGPMFFSFRVRMLGGAECFKSCPKRIPERPPLYRYQDVFLIAGLCLFAILLFGFLHFSFNQQ